MGGNEMRRSKLLLALTGSFLALSVGVAAAGEVVWWTPNWGEARAKELADKFMAANPGITIRMEVTTSDGLPQRVLTALQSGAPPDIIEVQHGWVNGLCAERSRDAARRAPFRTRPTTTPPPSAVVTWDGKVWAIPYRMETRAVIFNKGAFMAAGLDASERARRPGTELIVAAAAKLAEGRQVRLRHHRRR